METQLNKESYQKLIDEDIRALEEYMPKYSLEKHHIVDVLNWSVGEIYNKGKEVVQVVICNHPSENQVDYHDYSVLCTKCNCIIKQFGEEINPPYKL